MSRHGRTKAISVKSCTISILYEPCRNPFERDEQGRPRPFYIETGKPMVLIEGDGILVLGVDNQGERGNVRLDYPAGGIDEHRGAEPLASEVLVNRQAADPHGGDGRMRRKLDSDLGGKVG